MILTLPYPISANRYWATRIIKRKGATKPTAMTYVTPEAEAYKLDVGWRAKAAGLRTPLVGRVRVGIRLYPARPQDWAKRARRDPDNWADGVRCIDLDNARKILYDALKGIAYIDDKWIRADWGEICEPDDKGARVEVEIEPVRRAPIAPGLFAEVGA